MKTVGKTLVRVIKIGERDRAQCQIEHGKLEIYTLAWDGAQLGSRAVKLQREDI